MNRHLTDFELAELFQGIGPWRPNPEAMAHLLDCRECSADLLAIMSGEAASGLAGPGSARMASQRLSLGRLVEVRSEPFEWHPASGAPMESPDSPLPLAADSSGTRALPRFSLPDLPIEVAFRRIGSGEMLRAYLIHSKREIQGRLYLCFVDRGLYFAASTEGEVALPGIQERDLRSDAITLEWEPTF